jgi:ABC-type branched-subunit amino acid transport system ATPase component
MTAIKSDNTVLQLRDVSLSFGGNHVLSSIHLDVHEGELLAIIGPNGAGKTSLFNVLTRLYQPDGGQATLFDVICTLFSVPSDEVKDLRREASALKEVVAELTLENRLLKKSVTADG